MASSNENQKIYMVTGKGGVGKSTVVAAIAKREAKGGKKTLLVELGEQSYFQYVFGKPIEYEPTELEANFWAAIWGGETCLREYVYHLIKVKRIVDLFFDNRVMRTFIRAAPALKELALLGKITSGIRHWGPPLPFDVIVVDGFASGHFLALLRAPLGMAELIEYGPMGEQSRKIQEVLSNRDVCQFIVVSMPEELPVTETIELQQNLQEIVHQKPTIVCNRVYNSGLTQEELDAVLQSDTATGERRFAEFLLNLIKRQEGQLNLLKKAVGDFVTLPFVLEPDGVSVINQTERHLP